MTSRTFRRFTAVTAFLAILCVVPLRAQESDADVQTEVSKSLSSKRFSGVSAAVHNGIVTLTGTVDLYATKEDAEHKIHHKRGVTAVNNQIRVDSAGDEGAASDEALRTKLAEKLTYDRIGYGTTAFNSFTIAVQNGVVTLGGVAYGPQDKDSAISLVSHYPGVRDVVDDIEVAPVSPNDDRIRLAAARAVYGTPQLNRYALDPAKPIRITVVNGNITLTGVVDNKGDRDIAGLKANTVPGAFKVTNDLQVAGSSSRER